MVKGAVSAFLVFVLVPTLAYAVFYNDSNVIEIDDGTPPQPSASGGSYSQSGYGGGVHGYAQSGYGSGDINYGYDFSGESGASTGAGAGGSGGESAGEGNDTPSDQELEEIIIHTLIESGAFPEFGGNDTGSSGWWPRWFGRNDGGSVRGGAAALASSTGITIDAAAVREALRQKYDLRDLLARFDPTSTGALFGAREYGLYGASTILKDANIDSVSLTAAKFQIIYRSRGYLFAIFPKSFPVRISIVPEAAVQGERVQLKLPWYRFFVRKFFTSSSLVQEIDTVVLEAREKITGANTDPTTVVFDAVAAYLKKKIGTIVDSVTLGTPIQ